MVRVAGPSVTRCLMLAAGDEYNVICNESLFPPECYYPAFYTPPKLKELDRPCDINDVADWVVDYINSDLLVSLFRSGHSLYR